MKFHTEQSLKELRQPLKEVLQDLRKRRNFNAEIYIHAKARVLNEYMRRFNLRSCIIAVSGGLDSAATLALVHYASKEKGSPIEKIIPISLPIFKPEFTTNQDKATDRGQELVDVFGLTRIVIDLTGPFTELKSAVDGGIGVEGDNWASGQLVSYIRTPAIYYTTSLMSQASMPAIVCGTTNRDEGAYLGYVGKASDGMVDVQIVSDLHKSEVRSVAEYLGVPQSILEVKPTGDMFDGRTDEEVFGAPYDFVELFLLLKSLESDFDRQAYLQRLDEQSKEQYDILGGRLEDLHRYNGHKYFVGSPAYHLDILESGVPGGWKTGWDKVDSDPRGKEFFVNAFLLSDALWPEFYSHIPETKVEPLPLEKGEGYKLHDVLSEKELHILLESANNHGWLPVGIDGIVAHYKEGDKIGSFRVSTFSSDLARVLWKRISPHMNAVRIMSDNTSTDWDDHYVWRAIGISPLFRFIRYTSGGLLVPHYDAPYAYPNGHKTLMSLVLYLESKNVTGGQTRFIRDPQIDVSRGEKDYSDWRRFASEDEVLFRIDPKPGEGIMFDHRTLHDSLEISGEGEKIILRTDIVFVPCGLD
ncbi:NAD(+) synthase [bacterium]|nr:NAD(+) synthase [bacterium]